MGRITPTTHEELSQAAKDARYARGVYDTAMSRLSDYAQTLEHKLVRLTAAQQESGSFREAVYVQRRQKGGEWSSINRLSYYTLPAAKDGSTTAMVSEVIIEPHGLARLVLIIPGQSDEFQVNAEQFLFEVLEHSATS